MSYPSGTHPLGAFVAILLFAAFAVPTLASEKAFCTGEAIDGEIGSNSCFYVGVGYGLSHVKPKGTSGNGWFTGDDSDQGVEAMVGWRFKENWFAELKYADLGSASLDNIDSARELAIPNAEISYRVPSLMLGYRAFQWWNSVTLYGKLGAAAIKNEPHNGRDTNLSSPADSIDFEEQTSVQFVGGVGIEWQPRKSRWFARLNYDSYDEDAAFLSLSLHAHLGSSEDKANLTSDPGIANQSTAAGAGSSQNLLVGSREMPSDVQVATDCPVVEEKTQVYFDSNSWRIDGETRRVLNRVASALIENAELSVRLVGHADASGVEVVNQQVAWQRVRHVYNFLVRAGVDTGQLQLRHVAARQPAASNATAEGRAKNRRVEIISRSTALCGSPVR